MSNKGTYGFEQIVPIYGSGGGDPKTYEGKNLMPVGVEQLPDGTWGLKVVSFADTQGMLYGAQSVLNTTTLQLGASETYTGIFEQNFFPDIGAIVQTDQAGTLYFDFSVDSINWSTFPVDGFAVSAGINEFHTAVKLPRYFRARYVNGSIAQTYLRLYIYYGTFRQGSSPLSTAIASDADSIIVRSISPELDLALGRIGGQTEDTKFGAVLGTDAIDNAVDVWWLATDSLASRLDTKTFPSTPQSLFISSSNGGDTGQATVYYLDNNGIRQTVTPTLTGQTPVNLGVTGLDCNRAVYPSNVGDIYINTEDNHTGGIPNDLTTVLAYIPAAYGQTQQAIDTVPSDKIQRIKRLIVFCSRASGAAGSANIALQVNDGNGWITKRYYPITTAASLVESVAGIILQPSYKIRARVLDVSDTDTNITVEWAYDEVDA